MCEVGVARRKNLQHTLLKNIMVIPLVTVTLVAERLDGAEAGLPRRLRLRNDPCDAGGSALATVIVLGPRIGKFGSNGEIRTIKPHNVWLTCVHRILGLSRRLQHSDLDVGGDSGSSLLATNMHLMPTTLSGITFNFLMSLSGWLMAGFMLWATRPPPR